MIDQHFTKQPAADRLVKMARDRKLAPLAELLRATLAREPTRRREPDAGRRAGDQNDFSAETEIHGLAIAPGPGGGM